MKRGLRPIVAVASLALLLGTSAAPATAAGASDGLWYYDVLGVGDIHAEGLTGAGVTIAVMDGLINTAIPTLQGANVKVREPSFCFDESGEVFPATSAEVDGLADAGHGTAVASLISGTGAGYPGQVGVKGVAPGATVLYYAVSTLDAEEQERADKEGEHLGAMPSKCEDAEGDDEHGRAVNAAMHEAMDAGADIISISAGYKAGEAIDDAHIRALREGVVILGGVSNTDELKVSMHWPAGGNGTVGVQAADAEGTIAATDGRPNEDIRTKVIAPGLGILMNGHDGAWENQALGNGTSYATPIVAGFLALVKQKYPEATGNQLIQTLIHNTWAEDHELEFDAEHVTGYGYISPAHMLRVDPTQYPDENPLITVDGIPSLEEITNWVPPAAAPTDQATEPPSADSNDLLPMIGFLVVGLLVLLGIILLIILLVMRKSRRGASAEAKGQADG